MILMRGIAAIILLLSEASEWNGTGVLELTSHEVSIGLSVLREQWHLILRCIRARRSGALDDLHTWIHHHQIPVYEP